MGKCVKCIHYPWNVSIDPDQLLVFRKCHKDSGPRRWTAASRDAENNCALFEARSEEEVKTAKAPNKAPKTKAGKAGKQKTEDSEKELPEGALDAASDETTEDSEK